MKSYQIVLADDHALFRQGLKNLITEIPDLKVVGEAGDGLELLALLKMKDMAPHLIILDISMPKLRGIEAIREIRNIHSKVKILIVTMHQEKEYLYQALTAGADGYFLKKDTGAELYTAIEKIRNNLIYVSPYFSEKLEDAWVHMRKELDSPPITPRETDVLKLIAAGKSNREIGEVLFISVHTVERHRANIMKKLNVHNTAELVSFALSHGYI